MFSILVCLDILHQSSYAFFLIFSIMVILNYCNTIIFNLINIILFFISLFIIIVVIIIIIFLIYLFILL